MTTSVNGMAHFPAVIDWVHVVLKGVRERTDECSNEGKKSGPKRRSHDGPWQSIRGQWTSVHGEPYVEDANDLGSRRRQFVVFFSFHLESYRTRCP